MSRRDFAFCAKLARRRVCDIQMLPRYCTWAEVGAATSTRWSSWRERRSNAWGLCWTPEFAKSRAICRSRPRHPFRSLRVGCGDLADGDRPCSKSLTDLRPIEWQMILARLRRARLLAGEDPHN